MDECCFCGESHADVDGYECDVCGEYFSACESCMGNYNFCGVNECAECKGV